jgi:hypothetical protein
MLAARRSPMTKWTYKRLMFDILEVSEADFEAKLNKAGAEGWELVAMFDRERGGNSKECFFLFKREAQ